jgi:hypothetical protein
MDSVIIRLLLSNFQILFVIVTANNPKSIPLNIKEIVITNSQPNKLQSNNLQWNKLQSIKRLMCILFQPHQCLQPNFPRGKNLLSKTRQKQKQKE